MRSGFLPTWALMATLLLGGAAIGAEDRPATSQKGGADNRPAAEASERSITVYPVPITPSKNIVSGVPQRIAVVVGTLLERAGVERVEVAEEPFAAPKSDDVAAVAQAFGKRVAGDSIPTGYALYGEIVHAERKIQAIRTVLVDSRGVVVLADRDDAATFAQTTKIAPKDPMTCSVFLACKLQKLWGLADPLRKDAPRGKLDARLRAEAGMPSDEERHQIDRRLQAMRAQGENAKLTVYPVRVARETDEASAVELVGLLNEGGVFPSEAGRAAPSLVIRGNMDEQKVLWDTARAFREHVRKNPPTTQYALFADYGVFAPSPGQSKVSHVHFIVCDRAGDWVIVDFQNSHHRDFQEIDPKSSEDCNRLLVERLKGYLASD